MPEPTFTTFPTRSIASHAVRFNVLGPVEVFDANGRIVELGTPKQREVLSLLLVEPDRVVSLDRIIDCLWGDDPPATATGTLQSYISLLRRALEPDRPVRSPAEVLVTRAPGYVLVTSGHELDVRRFEQLVAEARSTRERHPARAVALFDDALRLWRGTPFADLREDSTARFEAARLEEVRRCVREDRCAAMLAAGDPAGAAADLERIVADEPLRESAWELLVIALYRGGRQADALRAFQQARRVLDEEVGLQPGPGLAALERRVLEHDPTLLLDAPPPAPADDGTDDAVRPLVAATQHDDAPFVGRQRQREMLRMALSRRGGLVLVFGEAGIGKTRLVETVLGELADDLEIAGGRSPEGDGAPAYWPWTQALGKLLHGSDDAEPVPALLGHVVPDAVRTGEQPPTLPDEPAAARFAVHQAVATFLGAHAARADRPLVVVLDDLHWADASSLALLQSLVGELRTMGVTVIGTYRPEEIQRNNALHDALGVIARERDVERISVDPLDEHDITAYVRSLPGTATHQHAVGHLARLLHERTSGNAFFLVEIVRLLASEGRLRELEATIGERRPLGVPHAVNDVVLRRLARLPDNTRQTLTLAAVAGREVGLEMLEVATGRDGDEVLDDLDPALVTRLLVETAGPFGTYRFSHDIVREALYQQLSPGQRARLHKRVGDAIAAVYAADPSQHVGELAHHYSVALPLGTAPAAYIWSVRAAEQAAAALADDQAAHYWQLAITAHERARPTALDEQFELHLALGVARRRTWDVVGATEAVNRAIDIAEAIDDPVRMARAGGAFGHASVWMWRDYDVVDDHVVTMLETALQRLPAEDSALRATTLGTLGIERYYAGSPGRAGEEEARAAVAMAERLGDPALLARVLNNQYLATWRPDNCSLRAVIGEQILALPGLAPEIEAMTLIHRASNALRHEQMATFRRDFTRKRQLREVVKSPELLGQFDVQEAALAHMEGRLDEAEQLTEQTWARRLASTSTWGVEWVHLLQRYFIARERGTLGDLPVRMMEMARRPRLGLIRPTAVLALDRAGRRNDAQTLLDEHPIEIAEDWAFDFVAAQWAEVAVEFDVDDPAAILATIEPYADIIVSAGTLNVVLGSMHLQVGRLLAKLGDLDAGIEHAEEALAAARRLRMPTVEARTGLQLAELLRRRGGLTDDQRATDLLSTALAQCDVIGMPALAAEIRALER